MCADNPLETFPRLKPARVDLMSLDAMETELTSPLPSGEVGAQRRVRGYGLSLEQRPLTRFAAQIDLSPLGRGEPYLSLDKTRRIV